MTLEVVSIPLGVYGTNCYLAALPGSADAVVIDPGDTPEAVARVLDDRGWSPRGILVTHGHIDHIGGVKALADASASRSGRRAARPTCCASSRRRRTRPSTCSRAARRSSLAGIEFRTFAVPGHSPASVAFAADGIVFVGDVLFAGSVGRTDLAGGDMDTLVDSIAPLMRAMPARHGRALGPRAGDDARRGAPTNPFLGPLRA